MLSAPMSFPFFLFAAEGMRQTTASGRYDMQVFIRSKWKRSHFNGRQKRVKTVRYRTIQSATASCVRLKKAHGAVKHIVSEFHRLRRFDPILLRVACDLGDGPTSGGHLAADADMFRRRPAAFQLLQILSLDRSRFKELCSRWRANDGA
ncbi:hypothetical protein HFO98_17125 [Rhizobium leguminosarum]|uniref:hypothetical protein n=1 Tax=Rhizobium leguminosarum TaxID=384 RepID=UPI001C9723C7|nr:hypothetical protein [Rhizobium leguminosarum]MBY5410159.1 hypothetical protein [Rhizobium leguminosarum]